MTKNVSFAILFSFLFANQAWVGDSKVEKNECGKRKSVVTALDRPFKRFKSAEDDEHGEIKKEFNADNLPEDVWFIICALLDKQKFYELQYVCTYLNKVINRYLDEIVWFENRCCGPRSQMEQVASVCKVLKNDCMNYVTPTSPAIFQDTLYYILGNSSDRKLIKVSFGGPESAQTLTIEDIEKIKDYVGNFDTIVLNGNLYGFNEHGVVKLSNHRGEIQKATLMRFEDKELKNLRGDQKIIVVKDDFFLIIPRLRVSRLVDSEEGYFIKKDLWGEQTLAFDQYEHLVRESLILDDSDRSFVSVHTFDRRARILFIDKDQIRIIYPPVGISCPKVVCVASFSNGHQFLFVSQIGRFISVIDLKDIKDDITEINELKTLIPDDGRFVLKYAYFHNDMVYLLSGSGSVYIVDKDLEITEQKIGDSIKDARASDSMLLMSFEKNGFLASGLFDLETLHLKGAVMGVSLDGAVLINDHFFVWRRNAKNRNSIYLEAYKINASKS